MKSITNPALIFTKKTTMTNLHQTVSKEDIKEMPRVVFDGKIVVISSETEAKKACDFLCKQTITGIDTETKPSFHKGVSHQVALLQVSTTEICFLFRLNIIGLCEPVKKFLSNRKTLKVGLSLHDDILSLHRRGDFRVGNFIDIQTIAPKFGIKDLSLQKIYANLFGQKISKGQRLSNWEADTLTEAQKKYAATDAWACLNLYNEFNRLKSQNDYILLDNNDEQIQEYNA